MTGTTIRSTLTIAIASMGGGAAAWMLARRQRRPDATESASPIQQGGSS